MTAKDKSIKIATDLSTLLDEGHSARDALAIIAKACQTDSDTIISAVVYAMAA